MKTKGKDITHNHQHGTHIYKNRQHNHIIEKVKHTTTPNKYIQNQKYHQQQNTKNIHKMHNDDFSHQST